MTKSTAAGKRAAATSDERDEPVVKVAQAVKTFRTGKALFEALRVDLRLRRGEFVAIVGGSGSGKSTLLNVVADGTTEVVSC